MSANGNHSGAGLAQLPDHWSWVPLIDLAAPEPRALTDGPFGSNLKTEHYTESGPRVIRLQNIGEGELLDAEAHISEARFALLRAHEARRGDIVVASLGERLPRACLVPNDLGPAIVKADCPRLSPHPVLNAAYLMWALNSEAVRSQAARVIHGVGRPRLKLAELKKLLIPLPPRPEQDRVVAAITTHLADIETGEHSFRDALDGVQRYRAACLAAAFSGELTGVRVSEAPLDGIADVQSGIAKGRPGGDDLLELPYIRTANVQGGYLDLDVIKTLLVTPEQREKHLLQVGDVLVLEGGDADKVGRGWLWSGEIERCLHQNHVFAVRPHADELVSKYLAYFINAPQARRYFLSCAKQTTNLASINKRQLKALPVTRPAHQVDQEHIVQRLDEQMNATATYEQQLCESLKRAVALRTAVLTAACTGQMSMLDSGDEPVSDLIARIRANRPAPDAVTKPARSPVRSQSGSKS